MSTEHLENVTCQKCGRWASVCICDAESSFAVPAGSATWCPMLRTGVLQISLYTDETLEIRDAQAIYAHLTPSETADFLRWIDTRDKSPNAEVSGSPQDR